MNKRNTDPWYIHVLRLCAVAGMLFLLGTAVVGISKSIQPELNAPQNNEAAFHDAPILLIDLDRYGTINGDVEWHLQYNIRGYAQVVVFRNAEEVKIFLQWLSTQGEIDYGWNGQLAHGLILPREDLDESQ